MITYTQMKEQAAANCGLYDDAPEMTKIVRDIRTGVKLFQNAARRYWTRVERKTHIYANQQYYQFPSDMLRINVVKVRDGNGYTPLIEIKSEDEWNRVNSVPTYTSNTPSHYFVKGSDEIGLFPVPSTPQTNGLFVTFEPRMPDMAVEDTVGKVDVEENSTIVTASGTTVFKKSMENNCYFTVTDGSDGNWYKVVRFIDSTHVELDNYYQGETATGLDALIGQCPMFPEEYHEAPVFYACRNFFMMRKDLENSSFYKQMYDDLYQQYRTTYGNKGTSGVINARPRPTITPGTVAWPGVLRG